MSTNTRHSLILKNMNMLIVSDKIRALQLARDYLCIPQYNRQDYICNALELVAWNYPHLLVAVKELKEYIDNELRAEIPWPTYSSWIRNTYPDVLCYTNMRTLRVAWIDRMINSLQYRQTLE